MKKDLQKREKVAEILQTARVQKGYTQQQVADGIGCQVQTINKIEKAWYSPNADILYLIVEFLDIKLTINKTEV